MGDSRKQKLITLGAEALADALLNLAVYSGEADNTIFEMCDDSSRNSGDVFRYDARELFVEYASRCDDKEKDEYGKRHHLRSIESLARQIKDAKLFEKTRITSWGKLNSAALIDIARGHLESGDVETAHSWLKKIPKDENYQAYERDKLLEEIYHKQGDSEKLTELLFQKFRSHHSTDTLQALLDIIGHDQRDEVIADEVAQILKTDRLRESDAEFLIAVGKTDEAEDYLLKRADQLDGNHYGSLLSLAEAMASENRHLVTSLMYRSLLISILERGYTKAYPHGIRYLKKLDKLTAGVADWKEFNHHEPFKEQIIEAHGRKRSFWQNYEVKK